MKTCPFCAEEIQDGAIKCKQCGEWLSKPNADESTQIRQVLKQYNELIELNCLECGYVGQMGVIKAKIPWYLTWWVLIPVLLTGIGFIPAFFLGLWRLVSTKHTVECPSCRKTLITK